MLARAKKRADESARGVGANHICVAGAVITLFFLPLPPVHAISVAPPPPCPKTFDAQSISHLAEEVRTRDRNYHPETWTAECAGKALSRKGEAAVPALLSLMQDHNVDTEAIAITSLCPIGKRAAAAVPDLIRKLNVNDPAAYSAYSTLVCVGADAKQVIPLLMEVAVSKPTDRKHSNESPYAISALGGLGKYDPQTVVPFLIRLLEQPSHTRDAARALGTMGHAARDSVPALRQHLTAAVSGDDIDSAAIFIAALARVGSAQTSVPILVPLLQKPDLEYSVAYALSNIGHPATAAVPALIARLKENGTQNANDRYMDIAALISIDERSRSVLDVLLPEATSDKLSNLEVFAAAKALAEVNPLPAEFAPALKSAINRPGTDPIMKGLFERALINAHSQPSS